MKKVSMVLLSGVIGLVLSGCGGSNSPKVEEQQQIPYLNFEKGMVIDSQKVLIDASYKTLLKGEIEEKGEILLYKTTIFFKDKNYIIFLSKEIKPSSTIEFILKDDKMTNLQINN